MAEYGSGHYFCGMEKAVGVIAICGFTILNIGCGSNGSGEQQTENSDALPAAVEKMQAAVKLKPDSAGLRLRLVDMLDSVGHYKEAAAEMDSLLLKDSSNYGLWFTKAQVLEHGKDTAGAIKGYSNAIRIYAAPDALLCLANLYAEKKDKRTLDVLATVQQMRLGRETDANCAFIAGVYYARTGNAAAALEQFDNCIANNYTYMEAYIEKGMLYFDRKEYKQAIEVFRFASTVNTLYADAYYYQARCYEMMGQKDSAILRFKQSLSLDKGLKEAQAGLKRLGE